MPGLCFCELPFRIIVSDPRHIELERRYIDQVEIIRLAPLSRR